MCRLHLLLALLLLSVGGPSLRANPPVASYIFPAGGRRGTTVPVHVGGLFLYHRCEFELLGPGVEAGRQLQRTATHWIEGPLVPMPDSQQAEDYPKDMAGQVRIAADAPLGDRSWRLRTSEGATPSLRFVVGDLPEIVEEEIAGDPIPVAVQLPVTINGRIFPREDVDVWTFEAHKGQTITAEVNAARLGSPLDSHLEVLDPQGRLLAENDDALGADSFIRFKAFQDGKYTVKIRDVSFRGGQAFVYRLTLSAGPHVERVYPLGGRRGSTTHFALTGANLPAGEVDIPLPADGPHDYVHRLTLAGNTSNAFALDLDDLPEHLESEPNDQPAQVKAVEVPAVLNGRIDRPGDVDYWALTAHKSDTFEIEVRAARLGSPLSAVLAVCDAAGKELAHAAGDGQTDPLLRFTAPADGTYLVRVAEQFHSRGGPEYAYRVRIAHPPAPDFRLQLASDALTLPRGGQARLKVQAERLGGYAQPIPLTVEGLPAGVTAAPTVLAANQPAVEIPLKAESTAAISGSRLRVRGSGKVGDQEVTHLATLPGGRGSPEMDNVLLAVALPVPFKVVGDFDMRWAPRGTVYRRHYRIERGGFTGPLEVSLADRQARHLQGVTGPTITVPAGANEFDYAVSLPPWMETGRTCRVCVMAVGVIRDTDGSEHEVSFSSVQQNEQMVAVVEPGRLSVETDRTSLAVEPGHSLPLPVRIRRGKGLSGPVKLELVVAEHLHGLRAEPVEVAADQDHGTLTLHFEAGNPGPFNMPVLIRATALDGGQPVVAEMPLELVP